MLGALKLYTNELKYIQKLILDKDFLSMVDRWQQSLTSNVGDI